MRLGRELLLQEKPARLDKEALDARLCDKRNGAKEGLVKNLILKKILLELAVPSTLSIAIAQTP